MNSPQLCCGEGSLSKILYHLLHLVAAAAFTRLVGNRAALAIVAAAANVFSFDVDLFYRLPASALVRVGLVQITGAFRSAPAENSRILLDRQEVHFHQLASALARAGFFRDRTARAVIFAIANVVNLAHVRGIEQIE